MVSRTIGLNCLAAWVTPNLKIDTSALAFPVAVTRGFGPFRAAYFSLFSRLLAGIVLLLMVFTTRG